MAEFVNVAAQTVAAGGNVVFADAPIKSGGVLHREGSGVIRLSGCTNQCRARYRVSFGANVAIPTGGTVGAVSLAISLDGEALGSATMIETPAAVEEYSNVFAAVFVDVARGCCATIGAINTGTEAVTVANANLIVERVA